MGTKYYHKGAKMVRVRFDIDVEDGFPSVSSELIHGDIVGNGLIKLDNTPFFVEGIALGDIVFCEHHADELFEFKYIVEESGNKAISIIFIDVSVEERVYQKIKLMGHYCEYGEFPEYSMLAVSVKKSHDLDGLISYLSDLEGSGKISYAELCL
jgi:hypothetical protein